MVFVVFALAFMYERRMILILGGGPTGPETKKEGENREREIGGGKVTTARENRLQGKHV